MARADNPEVEVTRMKFSKFLIVGLLSLGSIVAGALPSMARPGYVSRTDNY